MTVVETASGRVRGIRRDGVTVFAGMPYAAPPIGPLRFRAPRPIEPWSDVRDAVDFGSGAMQPTFEQQERKGILPAVPVSEDCLLLHVWTPEPDEARRPVMVWLHGGSFGAGYGRDDFSDGGALAAEQDVVVVSLNHRLGVFGFLRLGAVDDVAYPDADNVGMLDIVAALTWVRDNIAAFGGDPSNVTLFGWSGGGWKISTLLAMPVARGLFHKGIVQSGSYRRATPLALAETASRDLVEAVGIGRDDLDRISEIPAQRFLDAVAEQVDKQSGRFYADGTWSWDLPFAPAVDGRTLPRDPFVPDAPPGSAGIPLLVGVTRDEYAHPRENWIPLNFLGGYPETFDEVVAWAAGLDLPPATASAAVQQLRARRPTAVPFEIMNDLIGIPHFLLAAVRQLESKLAQGSDPVYAYLFDWAPRAKNGLAEHGGELPFVFGALSEELVGQAPDDEMRALSARMRSAWAAFARVGAPGHAGLPPWPRYDLGSRSTMIFDAECRIESDPDGTFGRILAP